MQLAHLSRGFLTTRRITGSTSMCRDLQRSMDGGTPWVACNKYVRLLDRNLFFPPFTFTSQLLVHTFVIAMNKFLFNKDAFRNTAVLDFNWLILTEPQTRFQDLPTSATHDFPTPTSRIEIELLLGMPSGMASLSLYLLRRQPSNGSRQRFGDRGWARARLKVDALLILGTRFRI